MPYEIVVFLLFLPVFIAGMVVLWQDHKEHKKHERRKEKIIEEAVKGYEKGVQ